MARLVDNPLSLEDWESVTKDDYYQRIVMSTHKKRRTYLLRKIPDDSSPMSVPPRGSLQAASPRYYENFVSEWTRKNRNINHIGAPLPYSFLSYLFFSPSATGYVYFSPRSHSLPTPPLSA